MSDALSQHLGVASDYLAGEAAIARADAELRSLQADQRDRRRLVTRIVKRGGSFVHRGHHFALDEVDRLSVEPIDCDAEPAPWAEPAAEPVAPKPSPRRHTAAAAAE